MDSEHALCRKCNNVVRLDWERCFHCGTSTPVPPTAGTSLLRSGLTIGALVLLAVAGMNAPTLLQAARQAPKFVAREVPAAPQVTLPAVASGPAAAYGAVRTTGEPTSALAIRTSTVSAGDVSATADERSPGGSAGRQLDRDATARAIENCQSAAAVDSLQARLRTAYPDDPSLALGGATWRLLKARRAELALR